jgi:hypothetical protein
MLHKCRAFLACKGVWQIGMTEDLVANTKKARSKMDITDVRLCSRLDEGIDGVVHLSYLSSRERGTCFGAGPVDTKLKVYRTHWFLAERGEAEMRHVSK